MSETLTHSTAKEVFEGRDKVLARGFRARNYSIRLHDHDFYEINIVLSGRGMHFIEDKKFRAVAGDVFVIPPEVSHGYKSEEDGFDVYHLIFKREFLDKYADEISSFVGFSLLFEIEPYLRMMNNERFLNLDYSELSQLENSLDYITELSGAANDESDVLRNVTALLIVGYLSQRILACTSGEGRQDGDFSAIFASLEYIHSSISEKLTVERLAAFSNMSRATYLRKFFKVCGTTPTKYILQRRVKMARNMLDFGYSKTMVAHECGFYDLSHMEKCMKGID